MLGENIRTIRQKRGFSQEELAAKINVVRQTVSKWEKGLSVPDSDMLIRLADVLEVSVSALLGEKINSDENKSEIAEQLARINEHFAVKNRRIKVLLTVCAVIIGTTVLFNAAMLLLGVVYGGISGESFVVEESE